MKQNPLTGMMYEIVKPSQLKKGNTISNGYELFRIRMVYPDGNKYKVIFYSKKAQLFDKLEQVMRVVNL